MPAAPKTNTPLPETPATASVPAGSRTVALGGTRQALLTLIKRHGELDVASLARGLGVSNVAIRQHLAGLEAAGQIEARMVRKAVGRPAKLYRLTGEGEKEFPQSSDVVALDLLARMEKIMGAEALEELFKARLKDLSKSYQQRMAAAKTWDEKLKILARIRDEEGYLANVESVKAADGTEKQVLVEHHCPVASIAKQHPMVCRFEMELFRRVLGDPTLKRSEHILSGGHACAYESEAQNKK